VESSAKLFGRWRTRCSQMLTAFRSGYSREIRTFFRLTVWAAALCFVTLAPVVPQAQSPNGFDGKSIFRFDTFGDEQLWTQTLQMQHVIKNVSPRTALSVGLKVDSEALPQELIDALKAGQVNLDDPAVTIQLLKLNAVVGVIGKVVGENDNLATVGITCALCHSTVDNSIASGIGKRLDGWPNLSLNVGAIIALSPAITDKSSYTSWGPGKFDPRFKAFDGTTFIPLNSPTLPVVIPPLYGLQGVGFETFTADGAISYWNNYVGVTQMGGHGSFTDLRPPIGLSITQSPDQLTPKLPALLQYQLSLQAPKAPAGSFQMSAARRGQELFEGAAGCEHATYHPRIPTYSVDPICRFYTQPLRWGRNLNTPPAVPPACTGPRLCERSGSIRRTSTMAALKICLRSSIITTRYARWD
jgi:hypothetical protein